MESRSWFEDIRDSVRRISKAEAEIAAVRETLGTKTQHYSGAGGAGRGDPTDAIFEADFYCAWGKRRDA